MFAEADEPEADPLFGELHAAVVAGQQVAVATGLSGPADAAARRSAAPGGCPPSQTERVIHRTCGPEPGLERMPHAVAPAAVAVVSRDGAVAGLLLAAGGGRRFGGAKALAELDGRLLVERGIDLLRNGGCRPLVVVLGAQAEEVIEVADLEGAHVVVNPHWLEGMGTSLRAGFDAVQLSTAAALVIALVDQPLIGPAAVRRIIQAWAAGAAAAVATYEDRPGHPVLLDRALWSQARAQAGGDVGARTLLRGHPELVTRVACDDVGDPFDVDTPAAMEQARAALARR